MEVAMCASGHIRSFLWPGVASSWKQAAASFPGARLDLFFVGHFGNFSRFQTSPILLDTYVRDSFGGDKNLAFKHALNLTRLPLRYLLTNERDGKCEDLRAAWKADGLVTRKCRDDPSFLQVMWMDHCFRQAEKYKYALIVRIRPDVALLQPIKWAFDTRKWNFMPKADSGNVDWFFVIPTTSLKSTWANVVHLYFTRVARWDLMLPDYNLINAKDTIHFKRVDQPIAIVRRDMVLGCRWIAMSVYRSDCVAKEKSKYFMTEH